MSKINRKLILVLLFFLIFQLHILQLANAVSKYPIRGKNGMVVTSEKIASNVGIEILKKGGNAVDAAVAVGFAMAVTYPTAGNIGGGGFMVIHFPDGKSTSIDFREKAPLKASHDMYIDENGNVIEGKSTLGYLACGVPGSVAGLTMALEKYGTMKLADVMKPALRLAKKGFPVSYSFYRSMLGRKNSFDKFPSSKKVFLKKDNKVYQEGEIFKQPDLYRTLKRISKKGAKGFYEGKIAQIIVEDIQKNDGIITLEDLQNYEAIERIPVQGSYQDYEIISMGPPSSGGIAIIQCLNILENYDLRQIGFNSSPYIHLLGETLRNVFAQRAHYLGDADFVTVPQDSLMSEFFAQKLSDNIKLDFATPSDSLKIVDPFIQEGNHTTHYNVVDKNGTVVAVTTTINSGYGSKTVVDGAGFLLNNEMDDFAVNPGKPNQFGLVEFIPNVIEPGKRMLSSMSPTIITKDGKFFMAVGAMGGPKIITATLQVILNVIDFDMSLQEAVNAPRIHHQWKPDKITYEKRLIPQDVLNNLSLMGHKLNKTTHIAEVMAILKNESENVFLGAADWRWSGVAVGY